MVWLQAEHLKFILKFCKPVLSGSYVPFETAVNFNAIFKINLKKYKKVTYQGLNNRTEKICDVLCDIFFMLLKLRRNIR